MKNSPVSKISFVLWGPFWLLFCGAFFIVGSFGWMNLLGIVERRIGRDEEMGVGPFIAAAFAKYADDNGGQYPSGKTSTEVFQKLYDGRYLSYGSHVYLCGPGKIENKDSGFVKLCPENVGWDVVMHADGTPLTTNDPGDVPLLFPTGILGPITLVNGPNPVTLIARPGRPRGYGLDECFRDKTTAIKGFSPLPDYLLSTSCRVDLSASKFDAKGRKYITIQP